MNQAYEIAMLTFVGKISNVMVMCYELQKELTNLKKELDEIGAGLSAKIITNEKFSFFMNRYSDIVKNYDAALKDFLHTCPDLEKIMPIEIDSNSLINDVTNRIAETEMTMNFKANFEESEPFLFDELLPALKRIIEIGRAIVATHSMVSSREF